MIEYTDGNGSRCYGDKKWKLAPNNNWETCETTGHLCVCYDEVIVVIDGQNVPKCDCQDDACIDCQQCCEDCRNDDLPKKKNLGPYVCRELGNGKRECRLRI